MVNMQRNTFCFNVSALWLNCVFFSPNSCLCPLTLSCFSKLPHWPSFPTGIIILSCSCYPCRHYQPDPAINPLHKGRPKATFTPNSVLQQKHTFSFLFLSKEPVFYAVGCCGSQHSWKKYTHTCRWKVESSWNFGHCSLHHHAAANDVSWWSSTNKNTIIDTTWSHTTTTAQPPHKLLLLLQLNSVRGAGLVVITIIFFY